MLSKILNLFLQSACPLCQRQAKGVVCVYCQKKIKSYALHPNATKVIVSKPDLNKLLLDREPEKTENFWVFAWGQYEGELKRAIALLKYHNQPELGILLGQWLGKSWLNSVHTKKIPKPIVIPIPLHQQKLQARGFNQSLKIAQGFCQVTGYPLQTQGLIRVKDTEAMFGLNPGQRRQNVKKAFVIKQKWRSQPPRSPLILVDDIYTTGSTIQEASKILSQYSITISGAAVVAIAQKKGNIITKGST